MVFLLFLFFTWMILIGIQELMETFQMVDCTPLTSLMGLNSKLFAYSLGEITDATLYRKLIGSLILLLNTRLDLSFSISTLSSFMENLSYLHWLASL